MTFGWGGGGGGGRVKRKRKRKDEMGVSGKNEWIIIIEKREKERELRVEG